MEIKLTTQIRAKNNRIRYAAHTMTPYCMTFQNIYTHD